MHTLRCPICGRPVGGEAQPGFPFCSVRCRQIDLGRWLGERYSIPVPKRRNEFSEGLDAEEFEVVDETLDEDR